MNNGITSDNRHYILIIAMFAPLLILILFVAMLGAGLAMKSQDDCTGNNQPASVGSLNGNTTTYNMKENEKIVYNYLKSQGFDNIGIAAIMGRIMDESHFNTHAFDGKDSYGIAQWRQGRWVDEQNWTKAHGKDMWSIQGQIMFEVYEMKNKVNYVYQYLQHATDLYHAEYLMTKKYEVGDWGSAMQDAQAFLASFGKGNDKTTVAGQAFPSLNTDSPTDCNIAGVGSGNVVKTAEAMKGWFSYAEVRPPQVAKAGISVSSIHSLNQVNPHGLCDCSGFVWLVLKICGYKVPSACWYTGSMQADARGSHHWLKQIPLSQGKAGDVIIVNDGSGAGANGHTAILLQDWHGYSTQIINMGGIYGRHGVNTATFEQSFLGLLSGGTITMCEPIK